MTFAIRALQIGGLLGGWVVLLLLLKLWRLDAGSYLWWLVAGGV